MQNFGEFIGVSVGPGDPELMTLKACKVLTSCDVIAVPRTHGDLTLALDIAKQQVDMSHKRIVYLDFLMTADEDRLRESHTAQADGICKFLAQGESVAMVNLGDASLYSTFSYLSEIVSARGYRVEVVAGVTSFCASAAQLAQSLTTMKQPLHIFPASYRDMDKALAMDGTKVIMKSGRALSGVIDRIDAQGLHGQASLVANCGLPNQKVLHDVAEATGDEGYFTTLLIGERPNGEHPC